MTGRKTAILIVLITIAFLALVAPRQAAAFGEGGCGEGSCSDCHGMKKDRAEELLRDMVDSVENVDFAEVPGLYAVEVAKGGKKYIIYLDFSESYLISGNVFSISDRTNITRKKLMNLRRVDVSTIPEGDSLLLGSPEAPNKVFVFTDPQCPYCTKLHPELEKVVAGNPDVAFIIKLLPLVKLHPDSLRISQSIMCSGSLKMLTDSFAGRSIPDPSCRTDSVDRTVQLARGLGITSTPTLVLPDGRMAPGYRDADSILALLAEKPEEETKRGP